MLREQREFYNRRTVSKQGGLSESVETRRGECCCWSLWRRAASCCVDYRTTMQPYSEWSTCFSKAREPKQKNRRISGQLRSSYMYVSSSSLEQEEDRLHFADLSRAFSLQASFIGDDGEAVQSDRALSNEPPSIFRVFIFCLTELTRIGLVSVQK